jgi:hypothetical protein
LRTLSVIARRAESTRIGLDGNRKPTLALAAGAPAGAGWALTVDAVAAFVALASGSRRAARAAIAGAVYGGDAVFGSCCSDLTTAAGRAGGRGV